MPDDPRVQELLDELADRDATPEEVCRTYPELLTVVRERWGEICRVRAKLDELFPVWLEGIPTTPTTEELPLPQVPGYEVEAVLGHGGMGVVFRARHLRLGRLVALKMTRAGSYAGSHERERFRREAEAVAALRHANIMQIFDVGDWAGRPYFTMELIDGGSLAERLMGTPQPARHAATLLMTLAEAVHAAHKGGIVHRDLKPANILFTPDGTPKVADFGLARRIEGDAGLTHSGVPLGTPSYMAPEQALGESKAIGPAVDVYALGAILYELLTGRPPFRAETTAETVLQVIDREPVPPSMLNARLHRDLQTICLKCLQKEPMRRYSSAAELGADLRRFLDGEAIAARPEGRLQWLARRVRRRPGLSASVAIATALVLVSLWLANERMRADRRREADQSATERAAADDLQEMVDWMGKKSWTAASVALERAKGRLGGADAPAHRQALEQGRRDLEMVARLDTILAGITMIERSDYQETSDAAYAEAFRSHGMGRTDEAAEVVASRIRTSNIRGALVDALDGWSVPLAKKTERKAWLLEVARRSDLNQSDWVVLARDPRARQHRETLDRLCRTAPVDAEIVPLFISLAMDLERQGGDPLSLLRPAQRAHPGDLWANVFLANALLKVSLNEEAVRYAQAAVAIRPTVAGYTSLGNALNRTLKWPEALEAFRMAALTDPTSLAARFNSASALVHYGRPHEGIAAFEELLRLTPGSALLHLGLGQGLAAVGRNDEALAEYRQSLALEPQRAEPRRAIRQVLDRMGRREEAAAAWADHIAACPNDLSVWDGFPEYCLFIGHEADYHRACRTLYSRFGKSVIFRDAEMVGRACLLRPGTPEETKQAAALVDRALADPRSKPKEGYYGYFMFAKGLAEYRMDRLDAALTIMRGDASGVLKPGPQLVEAMALHRLGRREEASKTLASAIKGSHWNDPGVDDRDAWIYHALRREAEELMGLGKGAKAKTAETQGR